MKRTLFLLAVAAAVFAGAFIVRQALKDPLPGEANTRRSGAMEALEFWTASRAYPNDDIPADKYYKAFLSSKRNIKQLPRELASSATWEPIGPTNLHGRSLSVAINPQNKNTVYLGTASGGLWRSHGGGLGGDWEMVDLGFPALGIGAVVFDPVDTNVIYLGTGEVYRYLGATGGLIVRTTRGSYGLGILKSTDGGTTWSKSLDWTYNQQRGVQAMKLNPLNPSTVWAATTEGMYKSTDAGGTWNNVWPVIMATDVVVHLTDTNRVLGAFGNLSSPAGAVYLTTDGGTSWLPVPDLPPYSGKTQLHMYQSNPDRVYASVCDSVTGVGGTWRTTDFGASWTELSNYTTNGIYGVQGWYSHYAAVHPTDSSQVFTASVGSSKSTDGGVTFLGTSGLYSDNHGFAIDPTDPDVIYSANDDGIYRSTNFGQSFTDVGTGMQTGQLYKGLASSTTDSNLALVQSQDHIPGYIYTGGLDWAQSAVDEAGWTAIDPSNDDIMYAMNRFGGVLYKSTNRGVSFSGLASFAAGAWNTPVVVSPADPLTVIVGTSRIYRSTTGGTAFCRHLRPAGRRKPGALPRECPPPRSTRSTPGWRRTSTMPTSSGGSTERVGRTSPARCRTGIRWTSGSTRPTPRPSTSPWAGSDRATSSSRPTPAGPGRTSPAPSRTPRRLPSRSTRSTRTSCTSGTTSACTSPPTAARPGPDSAKGSPTASSSPT